MAVRKKKSKIDILITILSVILLISLLLKFDAVAKIVDPDGKMGVQNIANDAFPILLGSLLVIIGIGAFMSGWVSAALIVVGVIMVLARVYQIWQRKKPAPALTNE